MSANPVISLILLGFFLCVFYGPWQELCTDYARQMIFEQRDALFDIADADEIDFNSRAYRNLRRTLELHIRFCHEMTIWTFISLPFLVGKQREQLRDSAHDAIDAINNQDLRKKLLRIYYDATLSMLMSMCCKSTLIIFTVVTLSPVVLCVFASYILMRRCQYAIKSAAKKLIRTAQFEVLEADRMMCLKG